MRQTHQAKAPCSGATGHSAILQRVCACGQHAMGGECEECKNKNASLQRNSIGSSSRMFAPPVVHEVLRAPGQPLDAATRAYFEVPFRHDFSHVRVHNDAAAGESANAVNASAYTVGNDIVFAPGAYVPGTTQTRHVLAHELAHVVQQSNTNRDLQSCAGPIRVGDPNSRFERAADLAAERALNPSNDVAASTALSEGTIAGNAITIQRLPAPVPQQAQPQQEQVETMRQPKVPLELWDRLEPMLDQELVNTYLELGPMAMRRVVEQVNDFFDPYDEVKTNQTFQDIINIVGGGGSNALQDKLSDYVSLSGGIGGAIAQAVQVLMAHTLTTDNVDDVKKRASEGVSKLEDTEFTRSSPLFHEFEKDAMAQLEQEVDQYWSWYDRIGMGATEVDIHILTRVFRDRVREEYGAASKAGQRILADIHAAIAAYLEKLRPQLEAAIRNQQSRRTGIATLSGFLGGGMVGVAIGAGASKGNIGWSALGGVIGAVGGAAIAGTASLIKNYVSNKKRAQALKKKEEK